MSILLVGLGGIAGSITRYLLGGIVSRCMKGNFPFGTFLVNISGAFLLGAINGSNLIGGWNLLLADGFLGAYTTFSTFIYEGFNLFENKLNKHAIIYLVSSLIIGVAAFFTGYIFILNYL